MIKTISLNKNTMFRRVYSKGTSLANKYLVAYILPNRQKINRLGITVSKKTGCAVKRNYVRRRIKEAYRLNESMLKEGFDIVIVARSAAADADYHNIESAFLHLVNKLKLKSDSHIKSENEYE